MEDDFDASKVWKPAYTPDVNQQDVTRASMVERRGKETSSWEAFEAEARLNEEV